MCGERVIVRPCIAPYGASKRQTFIHNRCGKTLENNVAAVVYVEKRIKNQIEIDRAVAKKTTVAFTNMEIANLVASQANGRCRVGLFDVHRECVEVQLHMA